MHSIDPLSVSGQLRGAAGEDMLYELMKLIDGKVREL